MVPFFTLLIERYILQTQQLINSITYGDCLKILPLLPNESIDLVVTDPPYLVNYTPRDKRKCANDDNSEWICPAFRELHRVLKPDSFCVSFYGWPWIERFMQAWKGTGFRPVSHLTWVKDHCSREGYTQSYHEVGYLLAKGKPPKPTKVIKDVVPWLYTGNSLHPNQKPIISIVPLIEAFSREGDVVLDPFAGSGTTGIAARLCNRQFILIEKVWRYYESARERLKNDE